MLLSFSTRAIRVSSNDSVAANRACQGNEVSENRIHPLAEPRRLERSPIAALRMGWSRFAFLFLALATWVALSARAEVPQVPYHWDSLPIGGGGFVSGIVTSSAEPGLIYARTDVGGAYRWRESEQRWTPLMDWVTEADRGYLGVESLAIDPRAPNRVFMLVGTSYFSEGRTAILLSSDYGDSFEVVEVTAQFRAHGNGMGRQSGERLQVDPNNGDILYCGARWGGLFKSVDAGRTWARLDGLDVTATGNENGVNLVAIDANSAAAGGSQTVFVGISRYGDNLFRSDDGGKTFHAVEGAPRDLMPQRAAFAKGNLIVTYANGAGPHPSGNPALGEPMNAGGVWRLENATGRWTDLTPFGESYPFSGVTVDPTNPDRIAVSTTNVWMRQESDSMRGDLIFVSEDGGASWRNDVSEGFAIDPNGLVWLEDKDQSIHWAGSLEFDPADVRRVWVASGNGLYRTDNIDLRQTVWKAMAKGFEETVPEVLISIPDGPLISAIADFDGFRHESVHSYAAIHRPRMGTTRGLANAGLDPAFLLRVGEDRMYYSRDAALTWTQTASLQGSFGRVALSADGAVFLHSPLGSRESYRSENLGERWTVIKGLRTPNARLYGDRVDAKLFYGYDGKSLVRSENGGRRFRSAASLPPKGNPVLCVAPELRGHIWAAMNDGGLYRSVDAGDSFERSAGVGYCGAVGLGKAGPGADYLTVYIWGDVGGAIGVFRSVDEGASWVRVNDDAHAYGGPGNGQFVVGDLNVFGRVYMSTAGRGIVFGQPVE